ncbi:MAG: B12-binding domain-containing radical SAM protein [Candidatus Omnitrophica bacterium]|nr:B12-binding domain-containing radical SAM protein [Candidatus Omnitrophota bacterium]
MEIYQKKPLDIALIQPPCWASHNPPLGLALLKSYLSANGLSAKNYDLNILLYHLRSGAYANAWDNSHGHYMWGTDSFVIKFFGAYSNEILNFVYNVLAARPRVIGISVHWASHCAAKLLAQKFKQFSPETKIIFGGPQTAYYNQQWRTLLTDGYVDAVAFGEGEESLREYLTALNAGTLYEKPVKGLAYLGLNGAIVDGGMRELIKSLDDLPFADFSDFDLDFYEGRHVLPTYFSRGCINRCFYCMERKFFPRFRNRTGQRVFDEVRHQLALYPKTRYVRMHDSVSNGNIRELETFCDLLIENDVKIGFNLENAVIRKEMDARFYGKLRKAGCTLIGYGLETPSKTVLKHVGKAACLDADFEKVVEDGVRHNIIIGINMMFGIPGEQDADFQGQLTFIKKLARYRRKIILTPALIFCAFPEGSEVHSNPDKYDVDLSNGEIYWESKDGKNTFLTRLAKFEEFCALAAKLGYITLYGVTKNVNKNLLLGQFYAVKKDRQTALTFLLRSFEEEIKTAELARDIIRLYGELSKAPDEALERVKAFLAVENEQLKDWSGSINTRREFNDFMWQHSLITSWDRMNRFTKSKDRFPAGRRPGSMAALKEYAKQAIFRFFENLLYRVDKRDVILTQLVREMDNKIDSLKARYEGAADDKKKGK